MRGEGARTTDQEENEKLRQICEMLSLMDEQQRQEVSDIKQLAAAVADIGRLIPSPATSTTNLSSTPSLPDPFSSLDLALASSEGRDAARLEDGADAVNGTKGEAAPASAAEPSSATSASVAEPEPEASVAAEQPPMKKYGFDAVFAESRKKCERRQRIRANRQALRSAVHNDDNGKRAGSDDDEAAAAPAVADGGLAPKASVRSVKDEKKEEERAEAPPSPKGGERDGRSVQQRATPPVANEEHHRDLKTVRSEDTVKDQQHQHLITRLEAQLTWGKERGVIGSPSGVVGDMSPSSSTSSSASSSVSNSAANTATWLPDLPHGGPGDAGPSHAAGAGAALTPSMVTVVDNERLRSIEDALKELNARLTAYAEREAQAAPHPVDVPPPASREPPVTEEIERKLAKVEAQSAEVLTLLHMQAEAARAAGATTRAESARQSKDKALNDDRQNGPRGKAEAGGRDDERGSVSRDQDPCLAEIRELRHDVVAIKERLRASSMRPVRRYYADVEPEAGGHVHYYLIAALLAVVVVLIRIVLLGAH